ncbi:MAG: DUF2666 family protein [Candidatus ainarchaeum sp.]|nr:DUF2666 family protein [Candidatus ainarchaeum sp.]MDD5096722.1 DUF2666 family protein [Candidatus ainarchaeum sp.]
MPEELKMEVSLPELKEGIAFDFSSASEKDVAYAISYCSEKIDALTFAYSGIEVQALDKALSKYSGKGPKEAGAAILSVKSLREVFKDAIDDRPALISVAGCYFFSKLPGRFGFSPKIRPDMAQSSIQPKLFAPGTRISLVSKYKDWVAIKKLFLEPDMQKWEIAGILAGINETLVKKAFDFAGLDKAKLDAKAAALTKGKRKSYQSIGEAVKGIEGTPAEAAYLYNSILSTFEVLPYANRPMLSKQYPDIKGPKMRGRKPKA